MSSLSIPFGTRITGTGSSFPLRCLTNTELARTLSVHSEPIDPEWIQERTGVLERRISQPDNPDEQGAALSAVAAARALELAGRKASEIDAIFYATCTPDTLIPSSACWLQRKLGATQAWAMDLNAACSGYLFAMATADQFIRTGAIKTALVVGTDVLSPITNWKDRNSCILFGDGAGATLLEQTTPDSPHRILSFHLGSDGTGAELFQIPAGESKMEMNGREMFKTSVRTMADYAHKAIEANGLKPSDIDWVIPHQANLRIIEAVAKRIDFPMSKIIINIDRYGNTSAATVPTALDEAVRDGRIQPGQHLLLDVFGAGVTTGSMLIRW